jgi:hypothetical protein
MVASITRIQSLNFIKNRILICYGRSQIFAFRHLSKDKVAIFIVIFGDSSSKVTGGN